MKKNIGTVDKVIRIVLALVFGGLYYTEIATGVWGIVALVAAAIMVLTSLMSSCPIYSILGFSSCPVKNK